MDETDDPRNAYEFDLFVSYAKIDDELFGRAGRWVSRFVSDLNTRLHMVTGREPRIWFDKDLPVMGAHLAEQVQDALRSSALFMPILSPAFIHSKKCLDQLRYFAENAGPNRVVKVAKLPSDSPFPLPNLLVYEFFWLTTKGLPRELKGDGYSAALDGLARQIALLIESVVKSSPNAGSRESRMQVFLCHSSGDKPTVRNLWEKLRTDGFAPWLDEKELLPGQDWELEIRKAIDRSGAIIVCLSNDSLNKEGFVQREIRMVLDKASEMPEDTIFLIPARLEECSVPLRLKNFQWVNLFEDSGHARLVQALQARAKVLQERR